MDDSGLTDGEQARVIGLIRLLTTVKRRRGPDGPPGTRPGGGRGQGRRRRRTGQTESRCPLGPWGKGAVNGRSPDDAGTPNSPDCKKQGWAWFGPAWGDDSSGGG